MSKHFPLYTLLTSLIILAFGTGFFLGQTLDLDQNRINYRTDKQTPDSHDSLYSSQTAAIRGQITKVNGPTLAIKNLTNGTEGVRQVSSKILISKPGKTPSSELSSIDLNKEALISLEKVGDSYQVTQVQFVVPSPSLPPTGNQ